MFDDLDETLRQLLMREVTPVQLGEVDVSFDAPDREWSGRLSRPTINCFLYDVRENEDFREVAWDVSRDVARGEVTRRQLPIRINTTYNVTVWARSPENEHYLLWSVLHALARFRTVPDELVQGALKDQLFPMMSRVARPEQTRTSAADLWQALDNRIRPSLTFVVTLTLDPDRALEPSKMTRSIITRTRRGGPDAPLDEMILIGGHVWDRASRALVEKARVRIPDQGVEVLTGRDGGFAFNVRRGQVTLVVDAPGRQPVTTSADVPAANYDIEV